MFGGRILPIVARGSAGILGGIPFCLANGISGGLWAGVEAGLARRSGSRLGFVEQRLLLWRGAAVAAESPDEPAPVVGAEGRAGPPAAGPVAGAPEWVARRASWPPTVARSFYRVWGGQI